MYNSYTTVSDEEKLVFDMNELALADTDWVGTVTSVPNNEIFDTFIENCIKKDFPPHSRDEKIQICEGNTPSQTQIVKVDWENSWFSIQLWEIEDTFIYQLKTLSWVQNWELWVIKIDWGDKDLEIKWSKDWNNITGKVMIKQTSNNFIKTIYTQDLSLQNDSTIVIDTKDSMLNISAEWDTSLTEIENFTMSNASVVLFNVWAWIGYTP